MFEPQPCCKAGHEYTLDNTWLDRVGHRRCRTCARATAARTKVNREDQARAEQAARAARLVPVPARAADHNIWDMYNPQHPEPDTTPVPRLGPPMPFSPPLPAPWRR